MLSAFRRFRWCVFLDCGIASRAVKHNTFSMFSQFSMDLRFSANRRDPDKTQGLLHVLLSQSCLQESKSLGETSISLKTYSFTSFFPAFSPVRPSMGTGWVPAGCQMGAGWVFYRYLPGFLSPRAPQKRNHIDIYLVS